MPTMTVKRRARIAAALTGAVAAVALSFGGPAYAENDPTVAIDSNNSDSIESPAACDGHSDDFRFRFYYHSNYQGAWVNVGHPVYDLTSLDFGVGHTAPPLRFCPGTGDGSGQQAANNSASVYNWYDGYCANVYYSAGYRGPVDHFGPSSGGNLSGTLNNNNRSINFTHC
ncbi:hypothetical protein [Streptomyces orinoci]|uniref:Peptidase inhibitor family I36 n=1 Tax=Streptomyces orinoci TaxID=67339 RepID=A0ABV3JWQ2_STRON|nr:hypothetical protein [Streptomyces orinoci]